MGDVQTMVRTELMIDEHGFFLAQGHDHDVLKRRIEEAAHSGGRFVDFVVVGNRAVSVLISTGTRVVFTIETVQFDARDTGYEGDPYGGDFDF